VIRKHDHRFNEPAESPKSLAEKRKMERRMTKEQFKQYLNEQTDILFDGEQPEYDGQVRVDIVSGLEKLTLVQVNTFGKAASQVSAEKRTL
jgi:hypothetical protein